MSSSPRLASPCFPTFRLVPFPPGTFPRTQLFLGAGLLSPNPPPLQPSLLKTPLIRNIYFRNNLGVDVLPHITNALMVTSIFSAGNTYTYAAVRNLYGMSLEGRAPRFLRKMTNKGVPIYCFIVVMCFPFLAFLSLSSGSNVVLNWFVNLITAGGIIDYIVMSLTYVFFYKACMAQGVDRKTFPYYGWFQPYGAYIALTFETLVVIFYGYSSFTPWDVSTFFTYYTMVILAPVLFIGWKLWHKTKFVSPYDADLVWERPIVDAYEARFKNPPLGFWTEMGQLVGFRRHLKDE